MGHELFRIGIGAASGASRQASGLILKWRSLTSRWFVRVSAPVGSLTSPVVGSPALVVATAGRPYLARGFLFGAQLPSPCCLQFGSRLLFEDSHTSGGEMCAHTLSCSAPASGCTHGFFGGASCAPHQIGLLPHAPQSQRHRLILTRPSLLRCEAGLRD